MPKFQYCGLNPLLIDIWKNIVESDKPGKEGSVYTINKFARIQGPIGNLGSLIHTINSEIGGKRSSFPNNQNGSDNKWRNTLSSKLYLWTEAESGI